MVPREGLEPPTLSLEVSCSVQLSYRGMVRVTRIELVSQIWKNCILTTIRHPHFPDYNTYGSIRLEIMHHANMGTK